MPRKGKVKKREVLQDPVFQSTIVEKFINKLMESGKKSIAEYIFYQALDIIGKKEDKPMDLFRKAIDNVKPELEVKSRRVGGANYQVPVEVPADRQNSLAIKWIVLSARERKDGKSMEEKLAREILDAAHNQGASIKKREDTHKMAEANRAFAHYRW
ncbi:MAG: 30S ribosomal protein S7 [Candidatus Hydrogenedentota bacterium]